MTIIDSNQTWTTRSINNYYYWLWLLAMKLAGHCPPSIPVILYTALLSSYSPPLVWLDVKPCTVCSCGYCCWFLLKHQLTISHQLPKKIQEKIGAPSSYPQTRCVGHDIQHHNFQGSPSVRRTIRIWWMGCPAPCAAWAPVRWAWDLHELSAGTTSAQGPPRQVGEARRQPGSDGDQTWGFLGDEMIVDQQWYRDLPTIMMVEWWLCRRMGD